MERCPVCRARLRGDWRCRRCGSDLSLPVRIEQRVRLLERDAVEHIATGELVRAEALLVETLSLHPTPLGRVLLRFVREHREFHPGDE